MAFPGSRLCGAKCRTKGGAPCLNPALKESNRCRMHGGYTHRLRTHGRLTLKAKEERKRQGGLLKQMKQMQKELMKVGGES
jgi:hypothetical protein